MYASTIHQTAKAFVPSRPLLFWTAGVVVLACAAQALPAGMAPSLNREDGPFEIASAVILAIAACLAVAAAVRRFSLARVAGTLVTTGVLLRELDFQKRFTYRSIESIGFYTRPIASLTEKLVALTILAALACAVWIVARTAWRRLTHALRERESWLGSVSTAGVLVACSLAAEKFLGFTVAEEVLEAGFAGVVVALTWQAGRLAPVVEPKAGQPALPGELFAFAKANTRARVRQRQNDRGHRAA